MNIVNLENKKNALTKTCLANLRQMLGRDLAVKLNPVARPDYDFDLHIGTKPPLHLFVEVKTRIATRNQAFHIILRLRDMAGHNADSMVFAYWIPELVAEEFRKAGIFFVDTQGNAFIRKPPHFMVDIRGKKPERPLKAEPGRLIEPAGLKVIHYFLTHPQALKETFRTVAEKADVALGTVHAVMKELHRGQWLLPTTTGKRRFGNFKGLIEIFVRGYALKLRPAYLLGRYRHKMLVPKKILDGFAVRLAGMEGHWAVTGGMAARELTHYLEPDAITLFVDDQAKVKLEQEPMLRDDADGNVTMLQLFGTAAIVPKLQGPWPLTTPLLIYAELLETGGSREIETAQMIYERFLETPITHG